MPIKCVGVRATECRVVHAIGVRTKSEERVGNGAIGVINDCDRKIRSRGLDVSGYSVGGDIRAIHVLGESPAASRSYRLGRNGCPAGERIGDEGIGLPVRQCGTEVALVREIDHISARPSDWLAARYNIETRARYLQDTARLGIDGERQ